MTEHTCTLTMTEEQLKLVKQLLGPSIQSIEADPETGEYKGPVGDLANQIARCEAIDTHMLFLCVYEVNEAYGGPEEGGWTYENWCPVSVVGYDNYEALVEQFNNTIIDLLGPGGTQSFITARELHEMTNRDDSDVLCYIYSETGRSFTAATIERKPYTAATTVRPHYC